MAIKAQKKVVELKLVPKIESGMKEVEKGLENVVEQIGEMASQTLYFGLGATMLVKEGMENFVEKAIKKGEASEKDVVEKIRSVLKMERQVKKVETTMETRIEVGVRKVLNSLDIPSKSDVEKLSKRVAELSGRVSKLTQMKKPLQA
jgi:poly(hydroxyalkanoate) granule-associated protein